MEKCIVFSLLHSLALSSKVTAGFSVRNSIRDNSNKLDSKG